MAVNIVDVGYDSTHYFVIAPPAGSRLLVDCGWPCTMGKLKAQLKRKGMTTADVQSLLITHFHPDHAGLTQELRNEGMKLLLLDLQYPHVGELKKHIKPGYGYVEIQVNGSFILRPDQSRDLLAAAGIDGEVIPKGGNMQGGFAALTILLLVAMVLARVMILKTGGTRAMSFGKTDKKDFLIAPFALFYFYLIIAAGFDLPTVSRQVFYGSEISAWVGDAFCLAGLFLMFFSLLSFGRSFRVGIDAENPDKLVTTGIFAFTRNPIYVAFGFVLIGQFLVFPNWILLVYLVAGVLLFHRQVLREEAFLKTRYGDDYMQYCKRVRRFF